MPSMSGRRGSSSSNCPRHKDTLASQTSILPVTVVVSTRSGVVGSENESLIHLLGPRCERLQVDSGQYVSVDDFVRFVDERLASHPDLESSLEEEALTRLAEKVAAAAYPVYLVAQLVTRSLIEDPVGTEANLDRQRYPSTVWEAFDEYLSRFVMMKVESVTSCLGSRMLVGLRVSCRRAVAGRYRGYIRTQVFG